MKNQKFARKSGFWSKTGSRMKFVGEIICSWKLPITVESKFILYKKPDSAPKIRIPASGENPGHKKPLFLIFMDEHK